MKFDNLPHLVLVSSRAWLRWCPRCTLWAVASSKRCSSWQDLGSNTPAAYEGWTRAFWLRPLARQRSSLYQHLPGQISTPAGIYNCTSALRSYQHRPGQISTPAGINNCTSAQRSSEHRPGQISTPAGINNCTSAQRSSQHRPWQISTHAGINNCTSAQRSSQFR